MSHGPQMRGQMDIYECIREAEKESTTMSKPVRASDVPVEAPSGPTPAQRKAVRAAQAKRAREAAMRRVGDEERQAIKSQQARLKAEFLERQTRRTTENPS